MKTPQSILIAASCVYVVVLVATAYFTRATLRRVAGAMLGGIAVAIVGIGIERLAYTFGWWRYPWLDTPFGPPLIYPVVVFMLATLALVGRRITRRFGWRGQMIFLVVLAIVGTLRDYFWAVQRPDLIVFAPGIGTALVDAAIWVGLAVIAQTVMRWVAGSAQSDQFVRRSRDPTQAHHA
jgi:hypothetical protein